MEIPSGEGKKKILKIIETSRPLRNNDFEGKYRPGHIMELNREGWISIKCGMGYLKVMEVQAESRDRCSAYDFLMGARLKLGDNILK